MRCNDCVNRLQIWQGSDDVGERCAAMIALIDYKCGNIRSVEKALLAAGAHVQVTSNAQEIAHASSLVLPGVGAFADASASLNELGLAGVIRERILDGVPFLGICLGMHLLFESGTECPDGAPLPSGLGIIKGVVDKLPQKDAQGTLYKIPHVGWNAVTYKDDSLFSNIPQDEYFYFTHSYAVPESTCTLATTTHSSTFPCAVKYGECAYGVQFHPEKSSDAGMILLRNFVNLAKEC